MIQQSRLSGAEKAGDDGGGNAVVEMRRREHSFEAGEMRILGIGRRGVEGSEEMLKARLRRKRLEKMVEVSG